MLFKLRPEVCIQHLCWCWLALYYSAFTFMPASLLRHFALTGKLLDSRLTLSQIIALRFASDEELPTLAQRAVDGSLSNDAIKKEIKVWRADTRRV
jgi:hypothetical protein